MLSSKSELRDTCRTSLRGVSRCIAAAVFYSSPTEGSGGRWNYSIRTDGALGSRINVDSKTNDQEIYLLPFQHSIDWAIANVNSSVHQDSLPKEIMEYPFTSLTMKQREDQIRTRYMGAIVDVLGVAIFIGVVGVTYQLTGLIAMERELGMSQLIDCMMPNTLRWQPQAARLIAAHLALDIIYGPGWIVAGIILRFGVYSKTSAAITVVYHLLAGLALSSFSIFGASFFKKAQLSGISAVIACLLLGVIAQMAPIKTNGAVGVLGLLFPPMNYVFFSIFMARWERQNMATDLIHSAPKSPWTIPGIAFWVFLIVQILVYPILGAVVERMLYGTASKSRKATTLESSTTLRLDGFTKEYKPSWLYRNVASLFKSTRQSVLAVNNLTLDVLKGQIMVLLGANGSGKSTTLDAISGLTKISSGEIRINYGEAGGSFGLCPQKNVLWDSLTVKEHTKIFNRLKALGEVDSGQQIASLLDQCDLGNKISARSKTLSGGQKRKLQLAMMFTGGSSVCCVDEVSSGLDPISRRKIWDILLAERGSRTILLTTHFLDEAELLADNIAILSKGVLKAQGSSVELKHRLGSGYRIHLYNVPGSRSIPDQHFRGISREDHFDETVYTVENSTQASHFISVLENEGIKEYSVSGPTIEDVFLKVAEEIDLNSFEQHAVKHIKEAPKQDSEVDGEVDGSLQLLTGKRISMIRQAWVLFLKRATVSRRNPLPYAAAFLIPVIAAGLVSLFLKGVKDPSCSGNMAFASSDAHSISSLDNFDFVIGPPDKLSPSLVNSFVGTLTGSTDSDGESVDDLMSHFHMVNSLSEFNSYIHNNFANVTPGGVYLGDQSSPPTIAWRSNNGEFPLAAVVQNALDSFLTKIPIGFQFQYFDIPWQAGVGDSLKLSTFFGLAMSVYPALFALYPTVERLRNVRALHYSNGVRSIPLWLAYLGFDFCIVLGASVLAIIIFRAVSDVWYYSGYLFVVFFLYGLSSTLLSYLVSLYSKSQLAAFAFAAGGQCVMFLLYFIAYMTILTYTPTDKMDSYVTIAHFTIGLITPVGNLTRSLFVALNIFSLLCRDREIASYPGELSLYGGPILYLIGQIFVLFGLLIWLDAGPTISFRKAKLSNDLEEKIRMDEDISAELSRVASSNDGLRVLHLTKAFGKSVAVEDVTFGVCRGEVFALLGPNGAGKTTTISLIRGDMQPSRGGGDIFVENISVIKNRAAARSHLGVCPQFDAMDQMTVIEHLGFYARIRGVPDVTHNVNEVMRAVGLIPFKDRMAMKLSGGNKRKLSLGIALMGNPTVLLLDEPSSGMDAASKRVMWKTLASVVPGRSIVLTTHSMEEADALANRAGIMAKQMLALGTTDHLRRKYGNMYHVHLVHSQAPHTSSEDMERIRNWVEDTFSGANIEQKTYHGQLRFSIPASTQSDIREDTSSIVDGCDEIHVDTGKQTSVTQDQNSSISKLFTRLEENRTALGIQFYSVSQTTLDQVFLTIVGRHHIKEENSG